MDDDARFAALEARIEVLEAELAEARWAAGPRTPEPTADDAPETQQPSRPAPTRRALIGAAGAAAVGAAAATVATAATPAAAANGDPVTLGQTNDATSQTIWRANVQPVLSLRDTIAGVTDASSVLNVHATTVVNPHGTFSGTNQSFGKGVIGWGTHASGYGGWFQGGAGNILLTAAGVAGPSRVYSDMGGLLMDSTGDLWVKVSNTEWRKLAGVGTAGAFHPITPVRILDTRIAGWGGIFNNETRVVDATVKSGPLPPPPSGVPTGVTSIVVNLAVTNTNSGGYAALWTNGIAWPGNASINWGQPNLTLSNGTVTAVDSARKFQCKVAGIADVVIDVVGYYR